MGLSYKIAEVAERSGFNPSTLRYYEQRGLVPPVGRTAAGYRLYDDSTLSRLAFIARAKQLGCSLEEITDLVDAWTGERCEPVQVRMRQLVDAKIAEAQDQAEGMVALVAQLRSARAALGRHTPEGPCDDECGCSTPAHLTPKPAGSTNPPIACTLSADETPARVAAWQTALAPVLDRQPLEGGVRLVFPGDVPLTSLVELVAAEQACCMFFRFAITVDTRGVALEVTAPPEAVELVHSLFGVPSSPEFATP
jgi:MerR family transcriptional regulator, copper efflux regulator